MGQPIQAIKNSFAGGEFSPNLYARTDLAKYNSGLRKARNFFIHRHGGASNRPGTHYAATAKLDNKKCRIIPFEFSITQKYTIEVGEQYFRFFTQSGQILLTGVPYEVASPYLEAHLNKIRYAQSADILYLVESNYAPQQLNRFGNTNWTLTPFDFIGGPFMQANTDEAKTLTPSTVTGTITLTANFNLFDPLHVGSLFQIRHYVASQVMSDGYAGVGVSASITCGGTWRIISHGTWTGKFRIEKSIDNGATWTTLRSFSSVNDFNANTFGTEDSTLNPDPFLLRVNIYEFSSGQVNIDLTSDPFYQNGIAKVTVFTSATVVTAVVQKKFGDTIASSDWSEGSWSNFRGWPSQVVFSDDRLVFAATLSEPQGLWMSKTGNYRDFSRSTPLLDTDGISINLPSRKMNGINGLVPLLDLLALTSSGEWRVGSADSILSPTTIRAKIQGYNGSSGIEPILIGNRAIFIQAIGNVVRDLGFELQYDGFMGTELSTLSDHLFNRFNIAEMAYQQSPESIVWCVRDDGILLSMTYMREQEVVAWTWHDTKGEFESICTIPSELYNEVWLVVKRGTKRFIERMVDRMSSTDPRKQFFVDCGISHDDPKMITVITKTDPIVITAVAHGFTDGDYVDISDVEGMAELNGNRYKVVNKTADTFELTDAESGSDIDGTVFETYVSGGNARKAFFTFSGLDHLEGKTVAILGDGNVFPQQVVEDGSITLNSRVSILHAGLPYIADLGTLNPELPVGDQTSQGKKIKVSFVTFRFLNSRGGWIGPNENRLLEIIQRTDEPLGSPIDLFSGDQKETLDAGYEEGRIFYQQRDPLPCTISGIIAQFTIGG